MRVPPEYHSITNIDRGPIASGRAFGTQARRVAPQSMSDAFTTEHGGAGPGPSSLSVAL
ncbi:MAG TPA: hypothetical protein VKU01_15155 [Bryobacteraceae bacterium]|nr:hypothetical protein [Bryobacteraceae bacterium]